MNQLDSLDVLESVLAIEVNHRTPGSYDYQCCNTDPCGWCLFIREWAAYRLEYLRAENSIKTMGRYSDSDHICTTCAKRENGDWMNMGVMLARGICRDCKNERDVAHWSEFRGQ